MARHYDDVLDSKRILLCVGSGGVGKTTTAAALAVEAARRGKKTLVLTIDPAKRLANSLGLEELGHDISSVPAERLHAAGDSPALGSLDAMMLDQKQAFDEMVARYASDPEAVHRILANPIYAQVSGSLAGSQEYAALAKLHAFVESGGYDMIVVDTPPTAHALDFLDAPQKLTEAIDSPAIEWFRKMQGGGGWSVVGKTGSFVLKRLSKFVGSKFLDDLALFFTEFNDILGGFRQRADELFRLLRRPDVGFVLVASPEAMAVQEALLFHQRLVSSEMPFAGFVINKVHRDRPIKSSRDALVESLARVPGVASLGLPGASLESAAEALLRAHSELQALAAADELSLARLLEVSGSEASLVRVPFFERDIHDIRALGALGRFLIGAELEAPDVSQGGATG